tara:strand:- start:67 stop:660 length:594 start_codon:yes stop_codon:yes gene_type:complete
MSKPKLLKGITKARQQLMTAAQKARAKKTQDTAGPSSRRDMKDAVKPKKEPSFRQRQRDKKNKQKAKEVGAVAAVAIPGGVFMGQGLNQMSEPRIKLGDKVRKARNEAELKGEKTFQVGSVIYNTKTGKKIRPPSTKSRYRYIPPSKDADNKKPVKKASGGLASAAKTVAGKTTRSRNKTKPRGVGVATRGYGKALK